MQISNTQIKKLQKLLKDELGLEYDTVQAQQAGLAIIRFVRCKQLVASGKELRDAVRHN